MTRETLKSGFLKIYKKPGITSYDAIRILKKRFVTGKIGHTGTLDPFAEGLLVILTGKMTKLSDAFNTLKKQYRAIAVFGYKTDTLDCTGKITGTAPVPDNINTVLKALESFKGVIKQVPPEYSAVNIKGERAYRLARKGISLNLKEKNVEIFSLNINSYLENRLDFTVVCSSGTYIRSLARDIGEKCCSQAYLEKLNRESIGSFVLDSDTRDAESSSAGDLILPYEGFKLLGIPIVKVGTTYKNHVLKGKKLYPEYFDKALTGRHTAVFDNNLDFLALIDNSDSIIRYVFVSPERESS